MPKSVTKAAFIKLVSLRVGPSTEEQRTQRWLVAVIDDLI